ncbi:MAG: ribonuclease Z [Taibaiella sp.]|nr:ribonuclease Z [Taibaiella sp.]
MKITILGNNSALPAFGRHPTAQVVALRSELILIDCGECTQVQMQRYGIRWRGLNYILISHLHGDHYFGLPGLLNSMSLMGRSDPLHLFAPAPLKSILDLILEAAGTVLSFRLHFYPLPEGAGLLVENFSFTISCFPVIHRIDCHGFVVETKQRSRRLLPEKCMELNIPISFYDSLKQGADYTSSTGEVIPNDTVTADPPPTKKYAYCADTVYTDSFLPYITGADAIYHESTYLHNDRDKAEARFHSTALQAAQLAVSAGVGMLLLGHFSSKYKDLYPFKEEAQVVFNNVHIAEEGNVYEL